MKTVPVESTLSGQSNLVSVTYRFVCQQLRSPPALFATDYFSYLLRLICIYSMKYSSEINKMVKVLDKNVKK